KTEEAPSANAENTNQQLTPRNFRDRSDTAILGNKDFIKNWSPERKMQYPTPKIPFGFDSE
ncbi:hypothetical protein ACFSW8_03120, partial [Rubritalea tangerina]